MPAARDGACHLHQSFNRGDLFALRLDSQNGAAIHNLVVHHYGAGTAFGAITDPLAAGEVKIVAQSLQQGDTGLDLQAVLFTVDGQTLPAPCPDRRL